MSDTREHVHDPTLKEQLEFIVRHCGIEHGALEGYETKLDKWVIDVAERAHALGVQQGREKLQEALRNLIGAKKW